MRKLRIAQRKLKRYYLSNMGSAPALYVLDQDWMRGLLIRWHLSEAFLATVRLDEVPEENALRTIITRDLPILIKEVLRLRPELNISAINL
jgi:hypothetical protein